MKLTVSRDALVQALSRIQGVINRKASLPVLVNVLLEADEDGQLRVAATDLDITIDGWIPAKVDVAGRTTVNGKRLFEVTKSLSEGDILLDLTHEDRLMIRSGKVEFVLNCTSGDEYPALPAADGVEFMAVDGEVLRELIERTIFSVSTDDSRPNLNGVYFCALGEGRVRMVSTDGHRLSLGERVAERGEEITAGDPLIIPRKGLSELKRVLDEVGREVRFGFMENNMVLAAEDLTLFIRLIDLKFPDYKAVIPKSNQYQILIDRLTFLGALKRIGLLASDRTKSVKIELHPGQMTLTSENSDMGRAREELSITGFEGEHLEIAFNARYVRDILSILTAERVEMSLNQELAPGLFREEDNSAYLFVVMPIRV